MAFRDFCVEIKLASQQKWSKKFAVSFSTPFLCLLFSNFILSLSLLLSPSFCQSHFCCQLTNVFSSSFIYDTPCVTTCQRVVGKMICQIGIERIPPNFVSRAKQKSFSSLLFAIGKSKAFFSLALIYRKSVRIEYLRILYSNQFGRTSRWHA